MEDRYLYRANRTDNGEWINGDLITTPFVRSETQENIPYILDITKADYDCFEDLSEGNGIFEVDSSTICQCTGLRDKNGKLIWENDIVRACWQDNEAQCEEIAQIAWDEFGYYPWLDEYHCDGCDLFNEVLEIEVIGNIFDNPELLESEE